MDEPNEIIPHDSSSKDVNIGCWILHGVVVYAYKEGWRCFVATHGQAVSLWSDEIFPTRAEAISWIKKHWKDLLLRRLKPLKDPRSVGGGYGSEWV